MDSPVVICLEERSKLAFSLLLEVAGIKKYGVGVESNGIIFIQVFGLSENRFEN